MKNNYQKDICSLHQYSSLLCGDGLFNHIGLCTTTQNDALFPIKVSDSEVLLLPAPEFSTLLYRGQNKDYGVCKPTIMRQMSCDKKVISILQKLEFTESIKNHALTKIFKEKYILEDYPQFPNYKLRIDYEAIAQHYEFKTNHLDFTRDRDVAMFFMACNYDNKTKKFTPINDNSVGVLYSYDFKLGIANNERSINPIGFQPFSRPDKQKAFSLVFNKNIDFNNFEFVKKEEFILSKKLSEKYFDIFDGGYKLFPNDEVSELAYEIQQSNYISKDIIEYYSNSTSTPKKTILRVLSNNGLMTTDNKYSFHIHNQKLFETNLDSIINDLHNRVKPRGICETIKTI